MTQMAPYDVGLVCLNGHSINSCAASSPEFSAKCCKKCGQPGVEACLKCSTKIRGSCHIPGVVSFASWDVPGFCHECGAAYPWTDRRSAALVEAIGELEELSDAERQHLTASVPDVLSDTPKTQTATARFKKAIGKTGQIGGKLLTDILTKVATEAVVKSIGM